MPKSVKMYRFESLAGPRDMAGALEEADVDEPRVVVDGRTHRAEIRVEAPRRGRVSGAIRIPYRLETDAGELLGQDLYRFELIKQHRLAVIQTGRPAPARAPAAAPGTRCEIGDFDYDRGAMERITERMLGAGAILHDPRFEFAGDEGYDGLARNGFTQVQERCATTRAGYRDMLGRSSRFEPVFRVHQADGIRDDASPKGALLKVRRDLAFSMYVDVAFESRVVLVEKYMLPEVRQGAPGRGEGVRPS